MRLLFFALLVFINSVICIKESDQSGYKLNHPPLADDNPISVSIVFEDDVITEKPHKHKTKVVVLPSLDTVLSTTEERHPKGLKGIQETEKPILDAKTEINKDNIPAMPKARALDELHIPVSVIYDSAPENIYSSKTAKHKDTNPHGSVRKNKHIRRRQQRNETTAENENPLTRNTKIDKPKMENLISVKSETQSIQPVKLQSSRTESVNPQRIAARQNPSSVETTTKGVKTKRVRDPVVPIVDMENYVFSHSGDFHYSYESGDGSKAHSEGQLRSINDVKGEAVSGGFSYTDNDGNDFSISYTADENGYRPTGAHLPTPPPIPPAIARALAYLATVTTPEPVTKPSIKHKH